MDVFDAQNPDLKDAIASAEKNLDLLYATFKNAFDEIGPIPSISMVPCGTSSALAFDYEPTTEGFCPFREPAENMLFAAMALLASKKDTRSALAAHVVFHSLVIAHDSAEQSIVAAKKARYTEFRASYRRPTYGRTAFVKNILNVFELSSDEDMLRKARKSGGVARQREKAGRTKRVST